MDEELFARLDATLRRHLGLFHRKIHISVAQCNASSLKEKEDVCFTNTIRVDEDINEQLDPYQCVRYPMLSVESRFVRYGDHLAR